MWFIDGFAIDKPQKSFFLYFRAKGQVKNGKQMLAHMEGDQGWGFRQQHPTRKNYPTFTSRHGDS
jgi:hypothetical protein